MFIRTFLVALLLSFFWWGSSFVAHAQTPPANESREVTAEVVQVEERFEVEGIPQIKFKAEAEGGEVFSINTAQSYTEGLRYNIKEGNRVVLQVIPDGDGEEVAYLSDVVRTPALVWIFVLFSVMIIAVGLWRGAAALLGLGVTIGILFGFVFPQILNGANPLLMTILGSVVILAVNMHLSHGFSKGTLLAYGSTLVGLVLAVGFSEFFVRFAQLSGLASEEATFLYWLAETPIDTRGILLASIVLGAVGVLDDIAITQSETVSELKHADPGLSRKELFTRAMRVGRHHIASTVNTLVLAYAGAAAPLLLLFMATQAVTVGQFINTELVAEEIIRTLAGTSALVLTVPIATWFATFAKGHAHSEE